MTTIFTRPRSGQPAIWWMRIMWTAEYKGNVLTYIEKLRFLNKWTGFMGAALKDLV